MACHPDPGSSTLAIAERYGEAVRRPGHEAIVRDLYRLAFDPVLKNARVGPAWPQNCNGGERSIGG